MPVSQLCGMRQKAVPDKDGNRTLVVVPVEKFVSNLIANHENSGHARVTTM